MAQEPSQQSKIDSEQQYFLLDQYQDIDLNELPDEDIETNQDEIDMEIETLQSILMHDVTVTDEHNRPMILGDLQQLEFNIYKSVTLSVYPQDSVSVQLTKIVSTKSEDASSGKKDDDVKVRISKVDYLPSFEIVILMPTSYPSMSPPLFGLKKHELYPDWEKVIPKEFEEIFELGAPCVFEWHHYLQNDFVAEYLETYKLGKLLATSTKEYDILQERSRETFRNKFAKEQQCCMVGYENYFGNSFFVLSGCSHYFCNNCIKLYLHNLIMNGQVQDIKCPDTTCKKIISDKDIEQIVTKEYFEKLLKFRLSDEVSKSDDITWCPTEEGGAVARIRGGNMFGECTECDFRFGLTCNNFYHSGKRCPVLSIGITAFEKMSKQDQTEFIQEQLADLYVKKYSKNCPSCNISITKITGCNKMTCFKCGKHFCWVCLKIIPNYDHFSTSPECWNTMGQNDIAELNSNDIEEVKSNIGETDMSNAIKCPTCNNFAKKKTESNLLTGEKCSQMLCFYGGKKADKEHYIKNSCHMTSKLSNVVNIDTVIESTYSS